MKPRLAIAALALLAGSCTFLLDFDEVEGHPCDESNQCLPGYRCIDSVCVQGETGTRRCEQPCAGGQKCDLRIGACTDVCEASVCDNGAACTPGDGCAPVETGLGASCTADADCAGAIAGCSTDPASPGDVLCACFTPVGAERGVCLGLPSRAEDCAACGGAACLQARLSRIGATVICAPGGFRPCDGDAECADEERAVPATCSLLAWLEDPGRRAPGEPAPQVTGRGFLAACATPVPGAAGGVGSSCDPAQPAACASGLCLPTVGEAFLCTAACAEDRDCVGVGVAARCVDAPIDALVAGVRTFDVARVCGSSPTLGAPCDSGAGGIASCGTDAPRCENAPADGAELCTRTCLVESHCPQDRGFSCSPTVSGCF